MSLQLDIALREIYFNVNGGYMSMEKLYRKAKEEGVQNVSRKKRQRVVGNAKHIHSPQTIPET